MISANEETPTPIVVKSLQNWMMYSSATLNVENDEFKNVILSDVLVDPTTTQSHLTDLENITL